MWNAFIVVLWLGFGRSLEVKSLCVRVEYKEDVCLLVVVEC